MTTSMSGLLWSLVVRWPRWVRLTVAWVAVAATIPPMVLLADAVASQVGLNSCGGGVSQELPWICSPSGRMVFLVVSLAVVLPLMFLWSRFLTKLSSIPDAPQSWRPDHASVSGRELSEDSVRLPFRQIYLAGEVHAVKRGFQRVLMIGGERLQIAGPGSREFDELVDKAAAELICQTMPGFPKFRLLMAIRPAGEGRVRAVGVGAQSAAAGIALAGLVWFGVLSPRPSAVWAAVCLLLLLASLSYLVLAFRAVRSLRQLRHAALPD